MIALHVAQIGWRNIPPATLAILGLNMLLYIMNWKNLQLGDVCLNLGMIYSVKQFIRRVLASSYFHVNDMHLSYNMMSLLWKGRQLEPVLGTPKFAWLVFLLSILSSLLYLLISLILPDMGEMIGCAVGFSDVLFGLKVMLGHWNPDGGNYVMGFWVPTQYLAWAELLVIRLFVPESSFLGHICGALAGVLLIRTPLSRLLSLVDSINFQPTPPEGGWGMGGLLDMMQQGMHAGGFGFGGGGGGFGLGGFAAPPPHHPAGGAGFAFQQQQAHVRDGVIYR